MFLLRSTQRLGLPYEWLRGDGAPAGPGLDPYPKDGVAQLEYILREGATPNGVYGIKMFPEHFDALNGLRWPDRLPNLRFVYLTRRDVLGQAISLSIARQTDSYANWMPARRTPEYSGRHIQACLNFIVAGEARWRLYFATNGITPIDVVYEDLANSPQSVVDEIAGSVDVKGAKIDLSRFELLIQRDKNNSDWRERFLEESGDRGVFSTLSEAPYHETLWHPS